MTPLSKTSPMRAVGPLRPAAWSRGKRSWSWPGLLLWLLLWPRLFLDAAPAQVPGEGMVSKPRAAVRINLNPGKVAAAGQFYPDDRRQEVRFAQAVQGRYFCLETLSAYDGRPYAAMAELNLEGPDGKLLDRTGWRIAYADSEEQERENGSADNILDGNANTFWHTQWGSLSPNHPHHVVVDLGRSQTIGGFCYLPRAGDSWVGGRIRDYRVYVGNDLLERVTRDLPPPGKLYLFGYFTADGDGLHFACSLNGYHWGVLNQGASVLKPVVGSRIMRDPFLMRDPSGWYHLVWTASWTGNYIGHATSRDLLHWSKQTTIPVMANVPDARNCWAPEMFWDTNRGQGLIFWSSSVPKSDRFYYATTTDFKSFSPAKLLYDPGFGVLDATMFQDKGRYCLVFKDTMINHLRVAFAAQPEGPYSMAGPPFGFDAAEGPSVLRVGDNHIVYYHITGTRNNGGIISSNLDVWKDISAGVFLPPGSEQGCMLSLEGDELNALLETGLLETELTPVASELGLGDWIWSVHFSDRQVCRLRRSFFIPGGSPITQARLKITADNGYTVYLDGEEVGRGGDPNDLAEYDLTWQMTPGWHVLAVEAFNDAFDAGMIAGLRVDLANGNKVEVFSDATWRVVPETEKNWKTQKQISLDWATAHIVGYAGKMWWQYPGQITRVPPRLPVSKHFWGQTWFLVLLLLLCALVLGFSIRQGLQLAVQARSQRQLERERARIASDLHDDLGAGLTQVTLLGEILLQEPSLNGAVRGHVQKLCDKTRSALKAMDEIIWTVNPRRDTVQDFVAFILEYAQEYLSATAVRCRLDVPENLPAIPLDLPTRRNLLLAFKEAVRNVASHSGATEVFLKIEVTAETLSVGLLDNGIGFALRDRPEVRNGVSNMQERMADVGGNCEIQAAPGAGCRITFTVPVGKSGFSSKKWLARKVARRFRQR